MKNNQKSTDLLQKAKSTELNLLSDSELSDMIETGKHLGTKQTKIIIGRLVMSITSILAVAATAAYLAFAPAETPEIIENTTINQVAETEQVQNIEQEKPMEIIAETNNYNAIEDFALAESTESEKSASINIHVDKVNVEGINIITIDNEQDLKNIGIHKNGNEYSFPAFKNNDAKNISTILLTLKKEDGENIIDYDIKVDKNIVSKFSPQLITNASGKKEMSLFDSGNMKMMACSDYITTDENGKKSLNLDVNTFSTEPPKDSRVLQMMKKFQNIQGDTVALLDPNIIKEISKFEIGTKQPVPMSLKKVIKDLIAKDMVIDNPEISDEDIQYQLVVVDSIVDCLPEIDFSSSEDSSGKKNFSLVFDELDSDTSAIKLNFSTTSTYSTDDLEATDEDKQKLVDSLLEDFNSSLNEEIYLDFSKFDDARLNKMLAIAIKLDNSSKEPDFILWYDISQELIEALPLKYREKLGTELLAISEGDFCSGKSLAGEENFCDVWRACNGGLKEMSIFPVPIQNDFTVEYTLTDDRVLDFQIHDLYGKQILTLKTGLKRTKGLQSEKFNIDLPSGMYLLSISSNQGEHTVQRLVVK